MPLTGPKYRHRVWNRTDLTGIQIANGNLSYSLAQSPFINKAFPPKDYKGETIPPYACMRVITNPVYYEDTIVWPVGRPDDSSLNLQQAGMHFFNGPKPIPFTTDGDGVPNGYGDATNDLPAPVLVDLTGQASAFPYGNLPITPQQAGQGLFTPVQLAGQPLNILTWLAGPFSGAWALHVAGDILTVGTNLVSFSAPNLAAGNVPVSITAAFIPYCILGQDPDLSRNPPTPTTGGQQAEFFYSGQVMWVGPGGLAVAAVATSN